ncbi:MAG: hypothetical protein F6K31_28550 [Symploca sp. SIO2G7]|nr:hypothetical protein [Symploca sp. SIO2G7]
MLLTPMNWKVKTVIAAAIAIPNLALSAKYYTSVATEEGKLKKLQDRSRKMEGELTRSQQLLLDSEQQVASNLLKAEERFRTAERLEKEAQTEKEAVIKEAQKQAQAILDEARDLGEKLIADKQGEQNQALKILAEEEQRISDERDKIIAEAKAIKAEAEESLTAANREWEQIKAATNEWEQIKEFATREGKLEGEFTKKQAQLEADAIKAQIELEKQAWESQLTQLQQELMRQCRAEVEKEKQEYYDACEEQANLQVIEAQQAIASEAKQKVKQEVAPLLTKIEKLSQRETELKTQLRLMYERLQATKKPKKPKETDQYSTIAWRLINFYEQHGIMLDFVSVRPAPDGTIVVCVLPWQQDKGVEKSLESYFNTLIREFDLLLVPTWDVTPLGYEIRLTPRPHHYGGRLPINPHSSQAYKFGGSPVEDEPETEIEQLAVQVFGQEMGKEINQQRSEEAHIEAMLAFRPPNKKIEPTSLVLDPVEMQWIEWAYKWREASINQPNMTRQNDLLIEVYGVTPGGGTDERSLQGESLRQRLHRIMDLLQLPRRKRGN